MAFVLDRLTARTPSRSLLAGFDGAGRRPQPSVWNKLFGRPPMPATSPWGDIVYAHEIAPGILSFKTATRSGYRLSSRRQRALPYFLRTADAWYEDISEWAAVAVVFHQIFDKIAPIAATDQPTLYHVGKEALKNWRPEEYEGWFQTTLNEGEIRRLAIMRYHRVHADRWIALDVCDDREAFAPDASLRVRAKLGGDPPYDAQSKKPNSPSRWFRVAAAEFTQSRGRPFLIDLAQHREIDRPNRTARRNA